MSRATDPIIEPQKPENELDPEVKIRLEHAGQWVAWTTNTREFVAAGETPEDARAAAKRAGVGRIILDWVPPIDARSAGV